MSESGSYTDKLALHRQHGTFAFRPVGTSGCEVVGPEGTIAWTTDGRWAAIVVSLLNRVEGQDPCLRQLMVPPETRPPLSRYA